jgi:hypothetical protein
MCSGNHVFGMIQAHHHVRNGVFCSHALTALKDNTDNSLVNGVTRSTLEAYLARILALYFTTI